MSEQDQKAQLLQRQYNKYQEDVTELQTQISTFQSQLAEHSIVDKTLSSLAPEKRKNRKCFKMVGGVLVEKTVDDVILLLDSDIKALQKQKEGAESLLMKTRKEMETWMKGNNVKIVRQ